MGSTVYFSVLFSFALSLLSRASPTAAPSSTLVHLTSGSFQGITEGAPANTDKWLGIPYAQPPVGSLRFKAPVPITTPAAGVKNATQFGDACPQSPSSSLGAPVGEDCLFLNVSATFMCVHRRLTFGVGLETCWNHCQRQVAGARLVLCTC